MWDSKLNKKKFIRTLNNLKFLTNQGRSSMKEVHPYIFYRKQTDRNNNILNSIEPIGVCMYERRP